jgi:hypothetical protein
MPALGDRRGVWSTPSRDTQVTPFCSETMSLRFREQSGSTVPCENVKVWAWDAAQLWSTFRVPIRGTMVNSYGLGWALTRPLFWGLYELTMAKRCLNPCEGSCWRWRKQVALFVFPCVPDRSISYLLSTTLIPYTSVSVLMSGNRTNGRRLE